MDTKYLKYKKKYLKLKGGTKTYEVSVSEPWFSLISLGLKSVEGRKNTSRFAEMQVGDIVIWTNNNFGPRSVRTRITGKNVYTTFKKYLETEGLDKCLPGINTIDQGVAVYYEYYTPKDEKDFGVVAIKIEIVK